MSITLVCVSNINHALTEFAVNKCMEQFKFDNSFILSDKILSGIKYYHNFRFIDDIITYKTKEGEPISWNFDLYNIFLLKNLGSFITTDHVLNIHYDGFIGNINCWDDEFLQYDYIGSPTYRDWYPLAVTLKEHKLYDVASPFWYNGGGGFSLRSKKLLNALADPRIITELSDLNFQRAEDITISIKYKKLLEQDYGIKFAPLDVSLKFSTELLTGIPFSFGFHGWSNIPLFLSEEECIWYLENLTRPDVFPESYMVKRYQALCLIKNYGKALFHVSEFLSNQENIKKSIKYKR